jgi:hypothetical protein
MRRSARVVLTAVAVVATLLLSACNDDDSDDADALPPDAQEQIDELGGGGEQGGAEAEPENPLDRLWLTAKDTFPYNQISLYEEQGEQKVHYVYENDEFGSQLVWQSDCWGTYADGSMQLSCACSATNPGCEGLALEFTEGTFVLDEAAEELHVSWGNGVEETFIPKYALGEEPEICAEVLPGEVPEEELGLENPEVCL